MKSIINKLILFFLITLSLYSQSIPDWALNPGVKYNDNKYLSAIGEGKTLKDAQINAYENLSKVFSTSIKLDINSIDRYNQLENNVYNNSFYEENTQLKSYNELFGVEFRESHYSKNEDLYRVIAVMEKKKTIKILKTKIKDNEAAIKIYLDNNSDDLIEKYSVTDMALILAKKDQIYYEQLVYLGEDNIELKYKVQTISALRDSILKQMTFNFMTEYNNSALTQNIEKIISKSGFKLNKSNPSYQFKIRIDTDDIREIPDFAGGGVMIYYQFQIDLLNKNDDLIYTFNFDENSTGKEYGNTESEAKKYILNNAAKIVNEQFESKFLEFFNQYIKN
ncbi:LPP20 family lipoprotein [Brachyspira murdochii]|uniref:LPP20 family lipoprotein n=1 Tax=Brachyspira murdochii TaxID=84378 RepID=UPI0030067C89